METTFFATESEIISQDQTNLDIMSNLIISNDGTILDGKYEIKREIARGGMGIVFEAYNLYNYKTVAIKMILADKIEPIQLKRFQKEIEAYQLLSHPNVIAIYDAGIYNNYPYIVMEYIKGVDICTYFKQYKEKDWKLCARLIYEVALGLEYIHSKKMIHRDIKPSNIIVRPNGSPVIIDLGLVKFNRSQSYNLTQSKEIVGTIEYMPIEQAQGKGGQIDVRTDVYSLGLVLYELLTGKRAYNGENLMELCYKIMTYYPPSPRKINPQIPEVLEKITLHAIEKQKEKRYASMKKFATALKEYLNDTTVKSISQYDEWIETNKDKIFSICIAVLLAIIFVIAISGMIIIISITLNRRNNQQVKPQMKKISLISELPEIILVNPKDEKDNTTTETKINVTPDSKNNQSQNYELQKQLANQGDAQAQLKLGYMYYYGQGIPKDLKQAYQWWEESAKQENAEAQCNLGIMRYNGEDVPKDLPIAIDWFEKAANQDYAQAQFNLGLMYIKGDGVARNSTTAVEWFEKAAELGHKEAQSRLKNMPKHILAEDRFNLGCISENGRDYTTAVKWFEKAAELGYKEAQKKLGNMYSNGQGVVQNLQKAEYWYAKFAEQGDGVDQYMLGNSYESGQGVVRNLQKAIYWWEQSAEQGYVLAQYQLGKMYYNGQGVEKDFQKAIYWLHKVENNNNSFYSQSAKKILEQIKDIKKTIIE